MASLGKLKRALTHPLEHVPKTSKRSMKVTKLTVTKFALKVNQQFFAPMASSSSFQVDRGDAANSQSESDYLYRPFPLSLLFSSTYILCMCLLGTYLGTPSSYETVLFNSSSTYIFVSVFWVRIQVLPLPMKLSVVLFKPYSTYIFVSVFHVRTQVHLLSNTLCYLYSFFSPFLMSQQYFLLLFPFNHTFICF